MKKEISAHGETDVAGREKSFCRRCKFWAACMALAIPALARGGEFEAYLRAERFAWEEFVDGARILKEDGPRIGGGIRGTLLEFERWRLAARAEATLGRVDYDGQTFGGEPATANSDYFGMRGELDAVLRPEAEGLRFHPRLGIGARYWLRRIAEGDADEGGYDENWFTLYAKFGGQLVWTLDGNTRIYLGVARRPALANRTYYNIELADDDTFSLEPGRDSTWDVEAGLQHGRVRIAAFYETLSFKESNRKSFPPIEVFQPKSEGSIAGVQVGLVW
ncbi:MAG TPA: hypothetical protein PKE12_02365 [Kiritimatiellia bacterium]|nr:hypothetical protein [Kiritimatiellia bacterium]